ncbi:cupin domain-containing protein [uncultured Amnibacterium sp.]|uniref:cupin domain-containing protein n=1 Tax=uncultured Amnibacterium sp. TaxID=1631851 RepID=UPI0035CB33EC
MGVAPVRRVVTGHDADGRAVVVADDLIEGVPNPTGSTFLTLLWTSLGSPVDNDDATDGRDREAGLTLPGGSVLRFVDLLPGRSGPMHRTSSLDYGIVVAGTIELILDDDVRTLVEAGQVVVQRGTIHGWHNPSPDTTARVAFVLLDASPATVDGRPLPDIHPAGAPRPAGDGA